MKTQPLSLATRERLNAVFAPCDRAEAERMLVERCGINRPLLANWNPVELERVRFAALKLSVGTLAGLRSAVELANADWRDLLVSAGFAHDVTEHERWRPRGRE